jgi:hypothetical protein
MLFNLVGGNVYGSRNEILGSVGFLAFIMELVEKTENCMKTHREQHQWQG